MTTTLTALEALLDFFDRDTDTCTWDDINDFLRVSECTLIPTEDVQSIFTRENLVALLDCSGTIPRVTSLFMRAIAEEKIAPAQHFIAIATHLLRVRRTGRYAKKPRLLTPSCEYLDLLSRISLSPLCLVVATSNRIQICRLLLAISLHHEIALKWIQLIRTPTWDMNPHNWIGETRYDDVTTFPETLLREIISYANNHDNKEFVDLGYKKFRLMPSQYSWWPLLPRLPCPFIQSHLCCKALR